MIVLRDADLERAANAAVWGGCLMTGQVCMSVERVYVEDAGRRRRSRRRWWRRCGALRVGANGRDAEIDLGPFTSPRQIETVERHVADARAKGARVLAGGKRRRERRRHLLRADGARRRRPFDARSCARRRSGR